MILSRRQFLRGAALTVPVIALAPSLIVPERSIFLPPACGWPLTMEEIIRNAVRKRAERLADTIVANNLLLRRLMDRRVQMLIADARGHYLDVGRDQAAMWDYLAKDLEVDRSSRPLDRGAAYELLPREQVAPTLPMPTEFRVDEKMKEPFVAKNWPQGYWHPDEIEARGG